MLHVQPRPHVEYVQAIGNPVPVNIASISLFVLDFTHVNDNDLGRINLPKC